MRSFVALFLCSMPVMAQYSYDVDGDGQENALTDGVLISRYLFGTKPPALCDGIVPNSRCQEVYENIKRGNCEAQPKPPPSQGGSCNDFRDAGKGSQTCTLGGKKVWIVSPAPGGWTIPPSCVNSRSDSNSRCENDGSSIRPNEVWAIRIVHKAENRNDDTRNAGYTKSETPGEMVLRYEVAVSQTPGQFNVSNRKCKSISSVETLDEGSRYDGFCKIPVGISYASFRPRYQHEWDRCSTVVGRRCRPKILGAAFYE